MTPINPQLWKEYMGDIPMPENCTYQEFAAARDELWKQRDNRDAVEAIKELQQLKANRPSISDTIDEIIRQEQEKIRP